MPTATRNDPHRHSTAAHELGHLLVWRAHGFDALYAEITGHGENTSGLTRLAALRLTTLDEAHGYLAGLLAGEQAELLWCEHNDMPYDSSGAHGDMDRYRWFRRTNRRVFPASVTLADLRHAAHRSVRATWPTIQRLTPILARTGRIH